MRFYDVAYHNKTLQDWGGCVKEYKNVIPSIGRSENRSSYDHSINLIITHTPHHTHTHTHTTPYHNTQQNRLACVQRGHATSYFFSLALLKFNV